MQNLILSCVDAAEWQAFSLGCNLDHRPGADPGGRAHQPQDAGGSLCTVIAGCSQAGAELFRAAIPTCQHTSCCVRCCPARSSCQVSRCSASPGVSTPTMQGPRVCIPITSMAPEPASDSNAPSWSAMSVTWGQLRQCMLRWCPLQGHQCRSTNTCWAWHACHKTLTSTRLSAQTSSSLRAYIYMQQMDTKSSLQEGKLIGAWLDYAMGWGDMQAGQRGANIAAPACISSQPASTMPSAKGTSFGRPETARRKLSSIASAAARWAGPSRPAGLRDMK